MTNKDKYVQVFVETFSVEPEVLNPDFVYQCIPAWDSLGHMTMVAALEDAFDIVMDMEDIIEFSSFTVGMEKLKKYGVEF